MTAADDSPWAFPSVLEPDGRQHAGTQWYAGQIVPGPETTIHKFKFDPRAPGLAVRDQNGGFTAARSSGSGLDPGVWTLGVRLRGDWWEVAFIPVMKIVVSPAGEVSYQTYSGQLDSALAP